MKFGLKILLSIAVLMIIIGVFIQPNAEADDYKVVPAHDFSAIDEQGVNFSLSDYEGTVIIIHFTGLETPICIECEEEMKAQIRALEKLNSGEINATIITINLRKNPYSQTGFEMAESVFGVNISWLWVEDFNPYPIASLYQKYWTFDGAFSNPSIVLINQDFEIVGVYNVYLLGRGNLDGIQTYESLSKDVSDIISGNWEGFKGGRGSEGITFLGIFILGILTAATPCSIALLVAMISYVGTLQENSKNKNKKYTLQGFWIGVVFTFGMSLVFFLFGMIISSLGIFLEVSTLFYLIAGIVLIILGINIFKPLRELLRIRSQSESSSKIMDKGQNLFTKISKKSIYFGAFFLGVLFSIGWAPCAISLMMPVFVLILAQKIPILTGGLLLFVFGIGHGIPIIPLCAVTSNVRGKVGNKYVKVGKWMHRIFGIIIIIIGIIMAVRYWGFNLW
ncbi:MAG: cytochrome c biogenesis protein [Thermoplasmatales archaeon]|nr:MAG: cytochrome c biogenesis protein [Thermoplasmatales archaeon]